ncbi:MAG TPA: GNAT family N-acetyltransferase [Ktedonobacteraceae bacterium]
MREYHFSNALNYTHEQLSKMHNASFHGYFVPIEMTAGMSADFWRINQIDANCSVVMLDQDETFVGFARMGTRGRRGWCGGFGIVPEYRGSGASRLLAEQMVLVARSFGLEMLQLEVLTQNVLALKLYKNAGFTIQRRLTGLEIAAANLPQGPLAPLENVPFSDFLPRLVRGVRPYWGYEPASLLAMRLETFILHGGSGGLVVQRANGNVRVIATAGLNELTDQELAAALRYIVGDAHTIQVYNEPDDTLLIRYIRLGFTEIFSQHEMFLTL